MNSPQITPIESEKLCTECCANVPESGLVLCSKCLADGEIIKKIWDRGSAMIWGKIKNNIII